MKRLAGSLFIIAAAIVPVGIALADSITNDVVANFVGTHGDTIANGGSTTVDYTLNATSGGTDPNNCDATAGQPATATVTSLNNGVTITSSPFQFTDCAVAVPVTFSSTTTGDHIIHISVTGGKTGSIYQLPSDWTLHVQPPPADTTKPVIHGSAAPAPNGSGWNNSNVTVSFTCTDSGSGIATNTVSGATLSGDGSNQSVTNTGTCTDHAGNVANPVTISGINIDKTKPTITAAITAGTLGSNGWYTSNVTVHYTCADNLSGVVSCPADVVLSTEGSAVSAPTPTVTDNAGNVSDPSNLITVKIDKAGPTANLAVTAGTAGTDGWYTSDVTVSTTGSDPVSGGVTCTADQFQTTETTGQVFNGSCTNAAGLTTNAAPLTVKLDKTGPTNVVLTPSGTSGDNGWYTSDVSVTTTGDEDISGPATCTTTQNFTSETTGTVVNGSCTNDAGLTTNAAPVTVKIDKTGPTANLAVTAGTAGQHGWYTSDVTVSTTGDDAISGGVTCTGDQFQTTETAGQEFNGSCTNAAGLSTDAAPLTVKLDKTGPTASLAVTGGTSGNDGWYTSDVTVSTSGNDSISDPTTCTADQVISNETAGIEVDGSCTNDAGLTTNATPITIKLDKTGPTANLAVTAGTSGLNGWYTSDVTVSTTGDDSISDPTTCTADQFQTTDTTNAGQVFNGSCTNDAGLTTNATPLTVKLDKTAPVVTLTTPAEGNAYLQGSTVTAAWTATDLNTLNVTATAPNGSAVNTSTTGPFTFTVTATDPAGNTTTVTHHYSVYTYVFGGVQSPLSISMKDYKQGSTIPVKFQIFNSVTHQPIQGPVATLFVNDIAAIASGGSNVGNTFRYDSTAQQYIYNLSTKSLSASSTNTLKIQFVTNPPANPSPFTISVK